MILARIIKLQSSQIDFCSAFAQADLPTPVYVHIPRGHSTICPEDGQDLSNMFLKLNKLLYGQVNSPKMFYLKLKKGMEDGGFMCLEDWDPCLFLKNDCIALASCACLDASTLGKEENGTNLGADERYQSPLWGSG